MMSLDWLIVLALDRRLHHLVLLMYHQLLQMARKGDFRTMASHGLLHLIVEQGLRQHLVVSTFDSFSI